MLGNALLIDTVKAPNSGFFGHREIVHYWELVHYWEPNNLVVNLEYIFLTLFISSKITYAKTQFFTSHLYIFAF